MLSVFAGILYSNEILFQGFIDGMVYALVAIGLVLIYKATGVINFAQGAIGTFGGFVMGMVMVNYGLPYWLAAILAIAASAAVSTVTELLIVRRLFTRPRLLLFVATLGVAQLVALLQIWLPTIDVRVDYPTPLKGLWKIDGVNILLRGEQVTVLIVVPTLVILLAYLLQRTRFGLAVRSAADNPGAAQLAGLSIKSVSTQVWFIAGVLSGISTLLIGPIQKLDAGGIGTSLGPELLLFSLTAAMFGQLESFPRALGGGLVVGVVNRLVLANKSRGFLGEWGIGDGSNLLAIFLILLILMLFMTRGARSSEQSWVLTPRLRSAHKDLVQYPLYRWISTAGMVILALAIILLPQIVDKPSRLIAFSSVLVVMLVVLSAVVLTGWAGQLSLGQYAFVGVGGLMTSYYCASLNYFAALGIGMLWGAGVALVIGIPALRLRGLYLGIATLGFALVAGRWIMSIDRLNTNPAGGSKVKPPVILGRYDLKSDKEAYYYLCVVAVAVVIYLLWRMRKSGIGRTLIAVRDNEVTASAYTISPTRAKLIAFAVSGAIGALAGGLLVPATGSLRALAFQPDKSLLVMSIAVVGGISSITGAVLGTVFLVGIPTVFESSAQVRLFSSGLGMLVVLMYFPGGLISLLHNARDTLLTWMARKTNWSPPHKGQSTAIWSRGDDVGKFGNLPSNVPALTTSNVSVRFGGRLAVTDVSINVQQGEIVGLIGTNGAGKTTLMNAISGFVPADGEIEVYGSAIQKRASHVRSRNGIGRAFQNAKLFGSLTVRETIMTALESRERSLLIPSMLGVPPSPFAERRKRKQAEEIIHYLGLGRYADQLISELSTGTRRIVELGSLIALDTQLMLLDEPTAGVAQKETEAFGPLIHAIRKELGSSILLIEHDMPMVMSISDRIYCLESGSVIAEGTPDEVRNDPGVIASYLGTDERAIQRSGEGSST
ncbi:MAG: branched-chain amino acid ABC transporter permease/ATP-binding protein [Acidimicrobiales bacterium]|nr:branched-chain amino acid ABC transporter permease/ATP-binding protein [Acidimicrobiales bacterium]HJM28914.1 branched-chain amino acid ABC transporter permease/ATP-binding protein [Acidimicrobiales bacterium]